ncbi:acyl-phosphate glycerol-3-phosphate acyltransferase [Albidovulum inexpectatum]|uniref:Glycerol-3-phosphate acyltransferase n=1 Tax=Albidovulum inexpectatum TaxID=196587 RepID=A0A2S5JI75_9RHOB|nr:glycerol-3-phosphate 1-O-acyltransferase PlsY [Albidovulum inexpectatum]PPB81071.1 acyl-phosphate glycerol-3-phosphate acyltransferase [Albidovulum inexpectatum]
MPDFTTAPLYLIGALLLGYLLGSIPFGVVITRLMGLGDLRRIGSGNIGATNVLRTGNKAAALATLILDGGKGAAAVLIARAIAAEDAAQAAALGAFAGHLFPVWLKFRGGKGVATFLGTLLALAWPVGLAACATWLVTALVTRISSLSALVSAALAAIWAAWLGYPQIVYLTVILATMIYWKHIPNIERLMAGTEPKIGGRR